MALSVDIYRGPYGDFTNGGVTSPARAHNRCILLGESEPVETAVMMLPFRPPAGGGVTEAMLRDPQYRDRSAAPILRVVDLRKKLGPSYDLRIAVPIDKPEGLVGPMFGGNFVYTSDSRFRELTRMDGPIHVHDRFETREQYLLNSL